MHGIANMIPKELQDEFYGFMKIYDNEELPDGAWWALLEEAASSFIKLHKLKVDSNDATHQYLGMNSTRELFK